MVYIQPGVPEERYLILSSLSPNPAQKRLAVAVVLALLVAFAFTAGPLSSIQLSPVGAFVPAYAAAMFVNDLITSVLLFAQFSILRSPALLVIASGYLFTATILVPWMLTFPGVFAEEGMLGAGLQSTAWLYILWHAGFPLFVIAYALTKKVEPSLQFGKGSGIPIGLSVMGVVALVCTATFLIIATDVLLPPLMLDTIHLSTLWQYAAGATALLVAGALVLLWQRSRTLLDLWLMVVLCAYGIEIFLISFPVPVRFSVGWYAGRIFGLVSGSLVLLVLLYEITKLYARSLHAVLAQRREREARLVTGDVVARMIAHEIRQPLSAMVTNAGAGLHWLDRSAPDLDEAKAALKKIVSDGHRAGGVIESVRTIFKRDAQNRISLNIGDLTNEVLFFLRPELQRWGVTVETEPNVQLPLVIGDPILLRQVLVNLITNAIDSMALQTGPRVLSVRYEACDDGVLVSIADTGAGLRPEDSERIFDPLFTTKPDGMGMGLSICRSIIETHEGRLWASSNQQPGAIFQFTLRAAPKTRPPPNEGRR
jgi:signal transduction histidine kinase